MIILLLLINKKAKRKKPPESAAGGEGRAPAETTEGGMVKGGIMNLGLSRTAQIR